MKRFEKSNNQVTYTLVIYGRGYEIRIEDKTKVECGTGNSLSGKECLVPKLSEKSNRNIEIITVMRPAVKNESNLRRKDEMGFVNERL
jgi:hypothetical protein